MVWPLIDIVGVAFTPAATRLGGLGPGGGLLLPGRHDRPSTP